MATRLRREAMAPAQRYRVRTAATGGGRYIQFLFIPLLLLLSVCRAAALAEGVPEDAQLGDRVRDAEIYLNDSFEATDAVAKAKALASAGKWTEAAGLLQATYDTAGDKLLRVRRGHYVGITVHVHDIIAEWPQAGIAAYRALFEREITDTLNAQPAPRSVDRLLGLFNRYFCTVAAAELADTIGQLGIESGDLALAERVYRGVLDRHPSRADFAARYEPIMALVRAMQGLEAQVDNLDREAVIRWMGEDRKIGSVLDGLAGTFEAVLHPAAPQDWPIFAGDPRRNRADACSVDELGLLWRADGFALSNAEKTHEGDGLNEREDRPHTLATYPVTNGELVFGQRYRDIFALHRNTGVLAWRFRGDDGSGGAFDEMEEHPLGWCAVTVHDGRVYASLPGDIVPYFGYESVHSPPELVCLDGQTGRVIWPTDREAFGRRFPEITFDSSPIVRNGSLFIVGRRRRSFGFEDCYLFRFNADNGAIEFQTHLGSASTGTFGSLRPTLAIAAMHGDTVYVCTNLGSVAAVSANSGAVRWLRLYESEPDAQRKDASWSVRYMNPWTFNPVIWDAGRVVCLPTYSGRLLVLDATDGRELHSVPTSDVGGMETLLGIRDELVCGAGSEVACYDLAAGHLRWSEPISEEDHIFGRGAWSGDRLLVPTRRGLLTFLSATGSRVDLPWDSDGHGGNLLALPDQLIVADGTSVAAYVRKADIWASLRERLAAAPKDPVPALEFAEVALRSGEYEDAIEALDEAVRRMGDFLEPLDANAQRRFFEDVLLFTEVMSTRSALEPTVLEKLFSYAMQAPPDAEAHLRYRLRFATHFEAKGEFERTVGLYQQILRDRSLRGLEVSDSTLGSETAGALAESRIGELLDEQGRFLYASFEEEASRWLRIGESTKDEAALSRVIETFPNSEAAPRALIAYAELTLAGGRNELAARLFARAYHRYPKQVDKAAVIRKIADAHEQGGRLDHAYRWLTKGVREHPSALLDYEGRSITFTEYRARLADVRKRVEPSPPDIRLPLKDEFTRTFEGTISLMQPWFAEEPACDWSRYFVFTEDGIRGFDSATNAELWAKPAEVRTSADLLIATVDRALFRTPHEVFALDAATGQRLWTYGEYPEGHDDEQADWERENAFQRHTVHGQRVFNVRSNGTISCLDLNSGDLLWVQTQDPGPAGQLSVTDLWVVYHSIREGRAVLHLLDAETGAAVRNITTDESRPVEDLLVSLDGQVLLVTSQTLAAFDAETGRRRWRLPLDGHLRRSSLLLDVDAMYLSDDGRELRKISLEDGLQIWRSDTLVRRSGEDLTVRRIGASIIASTTSQVTAIDEVTGLIQWQGTTPRTPHFVRRMMTSSYVIAVDVPDETRDDDGTVYFYDHRNASGIIPAEGGTIDLGRLTEVRAILAVDGSLVFQTGSVIRAWSATTVP